MMYFSLILAQSGPESGSEENFFGSSGKSGDVHDKYFYLM